MRLFEESKEEISSESIILTVPPGYTSKNWAAMRNILLFLFILIFLSSCSIYHTRPVSLEEAVEAQNRIKVITKNNVTYKFRELRMENSHLTGVAHENSNTARRVSGMRSEKKGKFILVDLTDMNIKEFHIKNNTLSVLGSILIPLAIISIPIIIIAASGPGFPGYP